MGNEDAKKKKWSRLLRRRWHSKNGHVLLTFLCSMAFLEDVCSFPIGRRRQAPTSRPQKAKELPKHPPKEPIQPGEINWLCRGTGFDIDATLVRLVGRGFNLELLQKVGHSGLDLGNPVCRVVSFAYNDDQVLLIIPDKLPQSCPRDIQSLRDLQSMQVQLIWRPCNVVRYFCLKNICVLVHS